MPTYRYRGFDNVDQTPNTAIQCGISFASAQNACNVNAKCKGFSGPNAKSQSRSNVAQRFCTSTSGKYTPVAGKGFWQKQ